MGRDEIYAKEPPDTGSFEFDAAVASVFPDMLKRSIPGYAASIQAIGTLAARYVQPGTRCYDLGCSLGAATLAMQRNRCCGLPNYRRRQRCGNDQRVPGID